MHACVSLQEEEAQLRRERAAAVAEGRKERDAGRRKALARKIPVTAIMSQQQRARVEEVLAQLRVTQLESAIASTSGIPFMLTCQHLCSRLYNSQIFISWTA